MKKVILIILLTYVSLLNAQAVRTNKVFAYNKDKFNKDYLKTNNGLSHHSISLGGGLLFGGDSKNILTVMSVSTTIHFSKKFQIEFKYDYCRGIHYKSDRYHILSIIPQIGFNLYNNKLKLYTGIGLGVTGSKNFGFAFPTGNAKIGYNFCKWFSINTETVFFPVMQKLNISFKLPY